MKYRIALLVTSFVTVIGLGAVGGPARATFPAHDGPVAFYADTGDGPRIYTMRPDGHHLRQVTDIESAHPDWSSDGRRIVFDAHLEGASSEHSILLMSADGTGIVDLTGQRRGDEQDPSFTPDGRRIVFWAQRCRACTNAIWSMDLRGHDRRIVLPTPIGGAIDPNVSPDGTMLSFVVENDESERALYVANMDGSDVAQIVPFSGNVGARIDWAPDGQRIVFTIYEANGAKDLATIRPDGTDMLQLTHSERPDIRFGGGVYSPDGRSILFRFERNGKTGVYRIRPDGSHMHVVLPLSGRFALLLGSLDWGARLAT